MKSSVQIFYTKLFISNEFVDSLDGRSFKTYNPATDEIIAEVQEASKNDVNLAVNAADKAFQRGSVWRDLTPNERGNLMRTFAQLMRRDQEYLAVTILKS